MVANHSLWMYFADAGLVVKTVMLILLTASVISWTLIIQRSLFLRNMREELIDFEDEFWSGRDLIDLFTELEKSDVEQEGLASIFQEGFREYLRCKKSAHLHTDEVTSRVQRAMRIAYAKEQEKLEQHLPFLASVGSISPYIGLFGTVWGIMTSFQALGAVQQATIAMVAPGISEALIATAMGLFAAIPAVLAYNRLSNRVDTIAHQYERFQEELTAILQRQ